MKRMLNMRWLVVAAAALSVVAVACSSSEDPTPTNTAVPPTSTSEPASTAVEFTARIENISPAYDFIASGVAGDGPAGPGGSFTFQFDAGTAHSLSFATMFVPSNDFFFAPDEDGIALYDSNGDPVTGDVTSQVSLWDAGTEEDQEPGLGSEQPLIGGPEPSTADDDTSVRLAPNTFGNLPAVNEVVKVTIESLSGTRFKVTIENISDETSVMTSDGGSTAVPITPVVWVIHSEAAPLFTVGEADRGEGLEAVAETGGAGDLVAALEARTGVTSPLAPGAFAIHTGSDPIFTDGQVDRGQGLEGLAENGGGADLAAALAGVNGVSMAMAFAETINTGQGGPALPGDGYEFTFTAMPGDNLSFATMFVQSNDLFFAPDGNGIALFDSNGNPVSGDVTGMVMLWDSGTEMNEAPGAGRNQAPRQSAAGEGGDESRPIGVPIGGYTYPETARVIQVTITPNS